MKGCKNRENKLSLREFSSRRICRIDLCVASVQRRNKQKMKKCFCDFPELLFTKEFGPD